MPGRLDNIIVEWARQNKKELLENWDVMKKTGAFKKIEGAK